MTDLVKIARSRIDDYRTHWEGCERAHRECLIQRLADEIEGLQAVVINCHREIYARDAEVAALRAAIKTHNDGCEATCDWRRTNETHPGSDGEPLSNCESYTGRGRLCPDCPRHDMIDAAREGGK